MQKQFQSGISRGLEAEDSDGFYYDEDNFDENEALDSRLKF